MSTTEHFQVIQVARAFTVSMVSWGWKRMPPLQGPRESLCCTRKPWKILTVPSSILTGMEKVEFSDRVAQQVAGGLVQVQFLGDIVELCLRHFESVE